MRLTIVALLAVAAASLTGCASVQPRAAGPEARFVLDAGPIAAVDTATDQANRVRAAGPFWESQGTTNGLRFRAVRPFYSVIEDEANGRTLHEYLWPVATSRTWRNETTWRWLILFGADRDNRDDDSRSRYGLFPIVFGGQAADGENFFSVFPIGGTMRHFMGRDRITYVLWPVYSHTQVKDLEAHHILWPFISWSRGDAEHGYRVFPFYGEFVNEDRFTKRFVLWPFWTSSTYDYPDEKGRGYLLFPLYGRVHTTRQDGWTVLWPFFRWSSSPELTAGNLPWPFIQYSRGEVDKFYVWPLWGKRTIGHTTKEFYLWPIVRRDTIARKDAEYRRLAVLPFIFSDSTRRPAVADGGASPLPTNDVGAVAGTGTVDVVTARYFKLWPLLSYRRVGDESSFKTLALWPVKRSGPVERNWEPLWTLFGRTRNGASSESELLWGLWRHRRGADGSTHTGLFPVYTRDRAGTAEGRRGWSVLGGLVARHREGLITRTRILYLIRFTSEADEKAAAAPAAETEQP